MIKGHPDHAICLNGCVGKVATRSRERLHSVGDSELRPQGAGTFLQTGSKAGIQAKHAKRLRLILTNLDQAEGPEDMDLPGLALHELKGKRKVFGPLK